MGVPWFALSPSPFSIIFYLILTIWGAKQLLKRTEYKRWKRLNAFTDSLFILGFIVLLGDLTWVIFCGLRFGWAYPSSVLQVLFSGGRDVAGITFCFLLIGSHFKNGILTFGNKTWWLLIWNALFIFVWFLLAPSPAWTDWTFAIRHGFPLETVLTSFFISHVIGKLLVATTYYTVWRKPQ